MQTSQSNSQQLLSVSELTGLIKKSLETQFPTVYVKGEISNFKLQSSGHMYFSLKDADAQIPVALFKGHTRHLPRVPKDGDQVVITGQLAVYSPRGYYQIIAHSLQFEGLGQLLLQLEQLKKELSQKGWFSAERKKKLPLLPQTIAVVTSPTGAVIRDIIHVLSRRFPGFNLKLFPVRVQGEEAAGEIAEALALLNKHKLADVIIVARGGGSFEDLIPFNSKMVCSAIYESDIPVISAVGHETDYTLCDLVADKRAPTPSAAAELVLPEKQALLAHLEHLKKRISHPLISKLTHYRALLNRYERSPFLKHPERMLAPHIQRLDELSNTLIHAILMLLQNKRHRCEKLRIQLKEKAPQERLKQIKRQLEDSKKQLEQAMKRLFDTSKRLLIAKRAELEAKNPKNLLKAGYALILDKDKPITGVSQVKQGQRLTLQWADGQAEAEVKTTRKA